MAPPVLPKKARIRNPFFVTGTVASLVRAARAVLLC